MEACTKINLEGQVCIGISSASPSHELSGLLLVFKRAHSKKVADIELNSLHTRGCVFCLLVKPREAYNMCHTCYRPET